MMMLLPRPVYAPMTDDFQYAYFTAFEPAAYHYYASVIYLAEFSGHTILTQ